MNYDCYMNLEHLRAVSYRVFAWPLAYNHVVCYDDMSPCQGLPFGKVRALDSSPLVNSE